MVSVIVPVIAENSTFGRGWLTTGQALPGAGLMPAQQTRQHIVRCGEDVPHIVEDRKAESVPQVWQRNRRKAEFQVVDEQRRTANWKSGRWIARSCLIQPESAMRVAPAREELFRQRDQRKSLAERLIGLWVGSTRAWRTYPGAIERLLDADRRGSRENKLSVYFAFASKGLISRVLRQQSAEIRFRAQKPDRVEAIQGEVVSFRAFQRIVALVANEGKARAPHTRGQRKNRNFARREVRVEIASFDSSEIEPIGDRTRPRSRAWFRTGTADLLPQINLPFQSLRREGSHIQAVVVEDRVDQLELVTIEQLGNRVADQPPLLEPAYVRLEGQCLITPQEIEACHVEFHPRADSCSPLRGAGSGRLAGLKLQSESVGKGIALGLADLYQYVLLGILPLWILHAGIDLAEDAQVIQPRLRVQQVPLAERIPGMHLQFSLHYEIVRMVQSSDHDLIDIEAFSLMNCEGHILTIRFACRWTR